MSFDLKKYLAEGKLYEDFPKNKWIYLTDEEKEEFAKELFDLINLAYDLLEVILTINPLLM